MTEKVAREFKATGYIGTVPELIQSWCDASALTVQQATDNIVAEADMFHAALAYIRRVRLVGKYAVKNSVGDGITEFEDTIAKLKMV